MTVYKGRVSLWDNLKFMAIVLVVVGHFADYLTETSMVSRSIRLFIYAFHMPLFFFVSGYLVDLKRKEWNVGTGISVIWKRVQTLLLPGLSFLLMLYARTGAVYFEWFLKVLFEMYFAYVLTRLVSHYLFNKLPVEMILHTGALAFIFCGKHLLSGSSVNDILSFSAFCNFYSSNWYFVPDLLLFSWCLDRNHEVV